MFPILIDLASLKVVLVAEGEVAEKRLAALDAAGAAHLEVYSQAPTATLAKQAGKRLKGARPASEALQEAHIVFLAGLDDRESAALAGKARAAGRLVNTEDVKPLCDFHVPSILRRGDLTISVSTGGKSPGLARRLRRHLEGLFGPEWAGRLDELGRQRKAWRAEGIEIAEIGRRVDAYIEEKGWLS
ncbi:siroheme synthase [Parvibaculum lavamentivorans DS-1]|uniref:precorrin-2 dehydrogenase n=1 Tax=Parvibaculum lavamentivorans (strain DS-1 / DSM 13023 / NCIMB 13966) TaxID=402881 RepID=A7HWV1_PARL1|nr:NAD(P)-dependent oxidoreductase [Parvibaculum lavamentivorans]ABS64384.1 siroheme synthase [Parvibaculum lavamentivorans DS-1]